MPKKSQDILLDENYKPIINNGDFVIGDSNDQHVELLLRANKGNFLEFPAVGVGFDQRRNGLFDQTTLERDIRMELEKDGYEIKEIAIDENGEIYIDYERIK